MRARLLGAWAICALAAYGCGGGSSTPPPPPDARDTLQVDGAVDNRADLRADTGGGSDATADRADAGDASASDAARDGAGDGARDATDGRDGAGDAGADVGAPTCSDHIKNSDETDIDCGGHCGKCNAGKACLIGADCTFGVCRTNHTCGECNVAADCPGTETECVHRSCTAGICGMSLAAAGTVLAQQTVGDCQSRQCATDGTVKAVADNSDVPDDRNSCTNDSCTNGAPMHTMLPVNSSCGGLNRCNAGGQCVGCLTGTDCPGTDTACQTRTCSAQGVCGFSFKASGTVLTDPTAGDCKGLQCDGAGNSVSFNSSTDLPVDGNPCTTDECSTGTPAHRPVASGTTCGTGLVCDGANHCVACLTASTCPGTDTECHTRTCINGACGVSNTPGGTVTQAQVPRDCKRVECNGNGATFTVPDVTDLPVDGNACTSDVCNGDTPANPPIMAGTNCGGTSVCDGAGACVGCLTAATCPGSDTECHTRTCSAAHACGISNAVAGKLLAIQTTGDCRKNQCDGAGNTQTVNDNTDLPIDGNVCTKDVCTSGAPSNPLQPVGTTCGTNLMCNGAGQCVGCITVADCPGSDTTCQKRACTGGQCLINNVAVGTVVASQIAGDCKRNQCDGMGNQVPVVDNTDVPVDGNQCTQDLCMSGSPSNPPQPVDTACNQNNGTRCNGIAGAAACVQCNTASQCTGGPDTECHTRACSAAGICSVVNTMSGTAVSNQTAGDCQRKQCDGAGNIATVIDMTDIPNDNNSCTIDSCNGASPTHTPQMQGTFCSDNSGAVCNAAGVCVGCILASDCPGGPDTECHTRVCSALGACSITTKADGTAVSTQTAGDCHKNVCSGGIIVSAVDGTDIFVDGKQCTQDLCTSGSASNPPVTSGTSCNQNGGSLCDSAGTCVQCLSDANCDATHDTACNKTHCLAGACTFVPEAANTAVADTTAGDCHTNVCDGMGAVTSMVNDADVPATSSECVVTSCMGGVPSTVVRPHGFSCSQNGGRTCDGVSACVLTVSLVRIGTGAAALANTSTATFIEERKLDGTLVSTVALPAAEGPSHAFGLSGTATSDGALSLSADGRYLIVPGYNSPAGTAGNVVNTASTAVSRLVARIDASGSADTSTLLGGMPFTANNVRGATSNDGQEFWVGGAGSTSAGVWYITFGQTLPAPVQVYSLNAVRWPQIFAGQLYTTSDKATIASVSPVGSGLPTTAVGTIAPLNGLPTASGPSPFGYVMFDRDANVAGVDTLYIADDSTAAPNQGIQKWILSSAGTWSQSATFSTVSAGTSPTGFRGLTGLVTGASNENVTLIATTGETNGTADRVVVFVDGPGASATGTVIVTSATNTTYRGVALTPHL